jgi:hypothetical protein
MRVEIINREVERQNLINEGKAMVALQSRELTEKELSEAVLRGNQLLDMVMQGRRALPTGSSNSWS